MPGFDELLPHVGLCWTLAGRPYAAGPFLFVRQGFPEDTGRFWRSHKETTKGMFIDLDLKGEHLQKHQGF